MSYSDDDVSEIVLGDSPDHSDVEGTNTAAESENTVDTQRSETSSDEDDDIYVVSNILQARFYRSKIEYLTVWEGGEKTWEPESNFNEGNEILRQFKLENPVKMKKLTAEFNAVEKKRNARAEIRKRQLGVYEELPENHNEVEIFGVTPDKLSKEAKLLYLDKNHKTSETEKKLAVFGFEQRASRNQFKGMLADIKNDESDSDAEPTSSTKKRAPAKKTVKQVTPKVRQVKKKAIPKTPEPPRIRLKPITVEPDIGSTSTSKPIAKPVIRRKKPVKNLEKLQTIKAPSEEEKSVDQSTPFKYGNRSIFQNFHIPKKIIKEIATVNSSDSENEVITRKPKKKYVDIEDSPELPSSCSSVDVMDTLGSTSSPQSSDTMVTEEECEFFVGRDDESEEDEEMSPFLAAGKAVLTVFKTGHEPADIYHSTEKGFIELMTTESLKVLKSFIAQNGGSFLSQLVANRSIIHPETSVVTPIFHYMITLASDPLLTEEKRNDAMTRLTVVCRSVDAHVFQTTDKIGLDHPIHIAAKAGSLEVVKLLASCGSRLMVHRGNKMVPIDCAIEGEHADVFEFLITQGAAFHQIFNYPNHPAKDLVIGNMLLNKIYSTMMNSLEAAGKRARRHMLPHNLTEVEDKYPIMIHNRRESNNMTFSFYRNEEDENLVYLVVFVPMVYHPGKQMWLEKKSMMPLRAETNVTLNKVNAVPLGFENPRYNNLTPSVYVVLPDEGWNDVELTLSSANWDTEQCLSCKFIGCKYKPQPPKSNL